MFFSNSQPVAVSDTVSHRALGGGGGAVCSLLDNFLRSGKPAAVANENPRTTDTIDKKIIACRNDIPSFLSFLEKGHVEMNAKEDQHDITG